MKWWFALGGAVIGLACAVGMLVVAYSAAPSMPGLFELAIQLFLVGMLAMLGFGAGLVLGLLVDVVFRRRGSGTDGQAA